MHARPFVRSLLGLMVFAVAAACGSRAGGDGGAASPTPTPDGSWESKAPLPGARQETAVVALGDEVVVIGGFTGSGQIVATVEAYDPAGDSWRDLPDLPVAMHHANAAVTSNGNLYVTGFLTGFGFDADGRVFEYVPGAADWTELPEMPQGSQRGSSGVAVVGNRIYVAGGVREGAAVDDFQVYDATAGSAGSWTYLAPLPSPLDHLAAGAIDGVVYLAGGRNSGITTHTAAVHAFDPAAGSWTEKASMPTSRGGVAAAVLEGKLYVFGGEGNAAAASGVFDQSEGYDPVADEWRTFLPMASPRHGTGAAAVGGSIYVPGGADVQAFGAVDTHESFTP